MRFSVFLFAVAAATIQAQTSPTYVGESCDLSVLGATEKESFLRFDQDLRDALRTNDIVALSLLVDFPLQVNQGGAGSFRVNNAASLETRLDEVFTRKVRKAIRETPVTDVFCRPSGGIMYGHGEAWVMLDEAGYGVAVINRTKTRSKAKSGISYTCRTPNRSFVIVREVETYRYRSWEGASQLSAPAGSEIVGGTHEYQGTGPCAHSVWTFPFGAGSIVVSGIGCFPDSNPPPEGARGRIWIDSGDGTSDMEWCF